MDKRFSEQRFRKSDTITFMCEKTGALAIVKPGLMAGRQAGSPAGRPICCKVGNLNSVYLTLKMHLE